MPSSLAKRLTQAINELSGPKPTPADLSRVAGVKPPSVNAWFSGRTKSLGKGLLPIAAFLGVTPEWLRSGKLPMRPTTLGQSTRFSVEEAKPGYESLYEITMIEAPRSCGDGGGEMRKGNPIVKNAAWFADRGVSPDLLFGLKAHGDAMADFIVDGDTVIFDSAKRAPVSGAIFLIEHPAGLKIKRIRLLIDGSWILENLNNDKLRFPDERVPAEQIHLLVIRGQYLYREG